jgi:hypothetical protein
MKTCRELCSFVKSSPTYLYQQAVFKFLVSRTNRPEHLKDFCGLLILDSKIHANYSDERVNNFFGKHVSQIELGFNNAPYSIYNDDRGTGYCIRIVSLDQDIELNFLLWGMLEKREPYCPDKNMVDKILDLLRSAVKDEEQLYEYQNHRLPCAAQKTNTTNYLKYCCFLEDLKIDINQPDGITLLWKLLHFEGELQQFRQHYSQIAHKPDILNLSNITGDSMIFEKIWKWLHKIEPLPSCPDLCFQIWRTLWELLDSEATSMCVLVLLEDLIIHLISTIDRESVRIMSKDFLRTIYTEKVCMKLLDFMCTSGIIKSYIEPDQFIRSYSIYPKYKLVSKNVEFFVDLALENKGGLEVCRELLEKYGRYTGDVTCGICNVIESKLVLK